MSSSDQVGSSNTTTPGDDVVLYKEHERDWFEHCEPTTRVDFKPTCNGIHELDSFQSANVRLISMRGSWRSVWKVSSSAAVLKQAHLFRGDSFDPRTYRGNQLDGFVMERLTGSPHVMSSYGFCGQSVLTEFAIESSSREAVKDASLNPYSRLRLARDLARGLADIQALKPIDFTKRQLDSGEALPFSHYDLKYQNVVSVRRGHLQINDFNMGILSRTRTNSTDVCPFPPQYGPHPWRSMEENANVGNGTVDRLQPCDVYALGNLFLMIFLQGDSRFLKERDEMLRQAAQQQIIKVPTLLIKKSNTPKDIATLAIWEAVKACFRFDPTKRPTALKLAVVLGRAYEWSQNKKYSHAFLSRQIPTLFR